jgi:hypothetical protein
MTMPKGWNNSNNNANTNNNNNLPLSRKQKKLLHQKAKLEASLNDVRMQIQKEEERDKGPRKRKQNKLSHHKTNLEISLQDVWRQIQKEEQKQQDKYLKKHDPPPTPQPPATPAAGGTSSKARKKTSKKKIAGIVILVILGIFGALIAIGASLSSTTNTTTPPAAVVSPAQQTEDRIARLLGNDPNRVNDPQWRQVATDILRSESMDNALLVIHSNTDWSAVVQDSDFVQESVDGFGSRSIEFECSPFGIFSHVVQKGTESGVLNVSVAQNGQIVKQANTGAAYGVVSIAGNCE